MYQQTGSVGSKVRWMIFSGLVRVMPTKHRAQLRQAKKATFQDIPLGVSFNGTFKGYYFSTCVEAIKGSISVEEISRIAVYIPNPISLYNDLSQFHLFVTTSCT